MDFKITTAALEGFRLIRREPKTVAIWSAVGLVTSVVFAAAMVLSGFGRMAAEYKSGAADPAKLGGFLLGELLMAVAGLAIASVLGATVYRALLRPDQPATARLRIGADEGRLMGLSIIMGLVFIGLSIAAVIPIFLIAFVSSMMGLASTIRSNGAPGLGLIIGYAMFFGILLFFATRLSLAGAMTFAEGRLRVFGSWRLTKGRFWKVLGVYALTSLTMLPLYLVMVAMSVGAAYPSSGASWDKALDKVTQPDFTSLASYFTPAQLAYLVLAAVLGGVINAVMYAPTAMIYRALAGDGAESQAEVFS